MHDRQRTAWRSAATATLLALGLMGAGVASAQTTVSGELTAADPRWDRQATFPPCTPGEAGYAYDIYPISHAGGTLTIEMRGSSSASGTLLDPYVFLYSGSFDPASPCTNLVGFDDDGGTDWDSLLSGEYEKGNYVIVASSYDTLTYSNDALGTYRLIHNATPFATAVPTLGEWGLMALSLALVGAAAGGLRRKRRA